MSPSELAAGRKAEFRYSRRCKSVSPEHALTPQNIIDFSSGQFAGYFFLKDPSKPRPAKIAEKRVIFQFDKQDDENDQTLKVFATGRNTFGTFVLRGTFDPATGALNVSKSYEKLPANTPARRSAAKRRLGTTPRSTKSARPVSKLSQPAMEAHLHGSLTYDVSAQQWQWAGRWAMLEAALRGEGGSDVKSFRYQSSGSNPFVDPNVDLAAFLNSASAVYAGDFTVAKAVGSEESVTSHDDMNMAFRQPALGAPVEVTGGGTNAYGKFSITGTYDPVSQQLKCVKRYDAMEITIPQAALKTPVRPPKFSGAALGNDSPFIQTPRSSRRVKAPPKYREPTAIQTDPLLMKCKGILEQVAANRNAGIFLDPVDVTKYPEYPKYVPNPIDISTIRQKLKTGVYTDPSQFIADMRLMFQNSFTFNNSPLEPAHIATKNLEKVFETKLKPLLAAIQRKLNPPPRKTKTPGRSSKKSKHSSASKRKAHDTSSEEEEESESESEESEEESESSESESESEESDSDSDSSDAEEVKLKKQMKKMLQKMAALKKKKKKKKGKKKKKKPKRKPKPKTKKKPKSRKPVKKKSRGSTPRNSKVWRHPVSVFTDLPPCNDFPYV